MLNRLVRSMMLLVVSVVLMPASNWAQSFNASIRGTVTDPSGATVPNVEVTLSAVETKAVAKQTTGSDGNFAFLNLATGNYELKAVAPGFREYLQKGIELKMNATARADIKLEVGAETQTIEVNADTSPLNFETPTVQSGIAPEVLGELPLLVSGSIRSAAAFVTLMPGVTQGASQNPYNTRINGGLTAGDEAVLDGVSMTEGNNGNTGMIAAYSDYPMSPEAISEISVLTSNYEPQYGATTSGVITAETKAGTKSFHGSAYEFFRNTALNARQFGIPRENRPKDLENDFGASIGGPIKIPKLFDSDKKKSYFFFNYEGFKVRGGVSTPILSIPTMQERDGDFSDWVDSDGNLIPVYDPATTRLNPNYNPDLPPTKDNAKYVRSQFMGCDGNSPNVICRSDPRLQNPLAKQWLQYLPAPTLPGVRNNYVVPQPISDSVYGDSTLMNIRVDQYWRDRDHFYVSVNYRGGKPSPVSELPPQLSTQQPYYTNYSFVNRANWTHTFSPTLLNHFAIGYLNTHTAQWPFARPYVNDLPLVQGVPSHEDPTVISFDDFAGFGNNQVGADSRPVWIANDLMTKVRGKHTFKFGGEIRKHANNSMDYIDTSGTLGFSRLGTGLNEFTSGNSMASFLLGQVSWADYQMYTITSRYPRSSAYNFHFGDTYKVTPKLTLNLGVRWDMFKPILEKFDNLSFLDPNGTNPGAGNRPGSLAFAGDKWGAASYGQRYPEALFKRGFAPRVGLAYSYDDKTVIRAGYGLFYSAPIYPGWDYGIGQDGFNTTINFSSSRDGYDPAFLLENGFPAVDPSLIPPFIDPSFRNGGTINNYRPLNANRLPYSQQWNLTIERQFTQNLVLNLAYVANKGTRLPSLNAPLNALEPKYLSMGDKLYEEFQEGQTQLQGVPLPYAGWWEQMTNANCLPTVAQALRPYPQYCGSLQGRNENAGNSTYHSFQLKVEHRMSHGMYLLGTYTISKLLSDTEGVQMDYVSVDQGAGVLGGMSPYERKRNKGLALNDVPQSFIVAFIYDIPVGRGKRFLNQGGIVDKVLGGWQMSNIFRATSGVPMFFRSFQCNVPGEFRAQCIPAINPGANPFAQDKSNFNPELPLFNADSFESKDSFNFYWGQGPRMSNVRGFGYHNHDLSLLKNTRISERINLQFRAEFFNVWNWHCFTARGGENDAWSGFSIFDTDVSGATFGEWNGEVSDPRNIQFGLKIVF